MWQEFCPSIPHRPRRRDTFQLIGLRRHFQYHGCRRPAGQTGVNVVNVAARIEENAHSGEILVAVTTNVGWTPLFSRAAAIVTDVGAPFSHAAIVARALAEDLGEAGDITTDAMIPAGTALANTVPKPVKC